MNKRNLLKFHCFGHWNISVLVIVSDFEIRISNFFTEKPGFSFRHYLYNDAPDAVDFGCRIRPPPCLPLKFSGPTPAVFFPLRNVNVLALLPPGPLEHRTLNVQHRMVNGKR
jgi:hypothetical protein